MFYVVFYVNRMNLADKILGIVFDFPDACQNFIYKLWIHFWEQALDRSHLLENAFCFFVISICQVKPMKQLMPIICNNSLFYVFLEWMLVEILNSMICYGSSCSLDEEKLHISGSLDPHHTGSILWLDKKTWRVLHQAIGFTTHNPPNLGRNLLSKLKIKKFQIYGTSRCFYIQHLYSAYLA